MVSTIVIAPSIRCTPCNLRFCSCASYIVHPNWTISAAKALDLNRTIWRVAQRTADDLGICICKCVITDRSPSSTMVYFNTTSFGCASNQTNYTVVATGTKKFSRIRRWCKGSYRWAMTTYPDVFLMTTIVMSPSSTRTVSNF